MTKKRFVIAATLLVVASAPLFTSWVPLSLKSPPPSAIYPAIDAFHHETGARSTKGWNAYYRVHKPGFMVSGLQQRELLPEGAYRYDFYFKLRSGHFANLLGSANDVIRVEVNDQTARETLIDRTYQRADFTDIPKGLIRKSLIFSTVGRPGHLFEPRVYWPGLCGIYLQRIERVDLPTLSARELRQRAEDFEHQIQNIFIEKGTVVSRNPDGFPGDIGDAAMWTGLYVAAEAWRVQVTRSTEALANMESSLWALDGLCQAAPIPGTVLRYARGDGYPLAEPGSKDTYTGFFYGVAHGLPYVRNPALRRALMRDLDQVAGHFLDHDLSFTSPFGGSVHMNPYPDLNLVHEAARDLQENPELRGDLLKTFGLMRWYLWLHGQHVPRGLSHAIDALKHPETADYEKELLPLANGLRTVLHEIQHDVHASALRGPRQGLTDTPYIKLDLLLLRALHNFDTETDGKPFRSLDQLKILPSESLHALHFIKVAAEFLPKPNRFQAYYQANLFEHKSLLRTAIAWHQIDEDALAIVLGETDADTRRTSSGHLSYLALHDLILLEKDPLLRFKYQKLFEAQFRPMRQDGNAMIDAMHQTIGLPPKQLGMAWIDLSRYPVDRVGKGAEYWREHHQELVQEFGGESNGQARDPLPADIRPRDAFLWQRSARSITGDLEGWLYPPLDYLFAYWLASNAANLEAAPEKS